jgi:hypothetical protein
MMDRDKANKRDLQLGFLDHVVLPVYRELGAFHASFNEAVAVRVAEGVCVM